MAPRSVQGVGDRDEIRFEATKVVQGAKELTDAAVRLRRKELEGEYGTAAFI